MNELFNLKYSEIIAQNRKFTRFTTSEYRIKIISNLVVSQFTEILEFGLRKNQIYAKVIDGKFDSILQECAELHEEQCLIIFWNFEEICRKHFFANLNSTEIKSRLDDVKKQIAFVLEHVTSVPIVLFNTFSNSYFCQNTITNSNLNDICIQLNTFLKQNVSNNVKLVETEKIIENIGISNAFDSRYYYSSKAPYTVSFFKEHVLNVLPIFLSLHGFSKKALILDCDNTLWKGIIGEDGLDDIEMSSKTKNGAVFHEVQYFIAEFSKKGIFICLCSKNNLSDVDNVLENHPDMILRNTEIVLKKINWESKTANIKEIASELNIGLDSIVFIDDSEFEINLIKNDLPQVHSVLVPKALHEYPKVIRSLDQFFYQSFSTKEDNLRVQSTKNDVYRNSEKSRFSDIEEYLNSLQLKICVYKNDVEYERLAQLTQKTNQFSLTTQRYTSEQIAQFIKKENAFVYYFAASDRFGEYGITGLCIIVKNSEDETYEIDSFLMSCRIIGRNLEFAFLNYIVKDLCQNGIDQLRAKYVRTSKNSLTINFFDRAGFEILKNEVDEKIYIFNTNKTLLIPLTKIEVCACTKK